MKFLIVLLPVAMCLPAFLNEDKLKADVQFLAQKFASSDLTRQACEAECQKYMDEDKELNVAFGCPIACMGLQSELVKLVSPDNHQKRAVLGGLLDVNMLKHEAQLLLNVIGNNATEQVCEGACHHLLQNGHIMNYACTPACKGLQVLVHTFHLTPDPTTTVATPISA